MTSRAAAAEVTRQRIVDAAADAFTTQWYDDVTLRRIASVAGVALQTVLNHFPTKDELFTAAIARFGDRIEARRWSVTPGDVDGAIRVLVDDYERTGEATLRFLALEERVPLVRPAIDRGRQGHEDWVQHAFPAALRGLQGRTQARRVAQLVAVCDVYTWKLLRRDKGLSRDQTITAMRELVLALHPQDRGGSA